MDLDNMKTETWLMLDSCFLPEGMSAENADLLGFQLNECLLTSTAEPALNMPNANVRSGILIWKCTIRAAAVLGGAVNMLATKVGGSLNFGGSKLYNYSGPGIGGDNMRVSGSLFLRRGLEVHGGGALGAVRLNRARIDNAVDFSGARLCNETGPAISADSMVADTLQIRNGFTAESTRASATIRLPNVKVATAEISKAVVKNGAGPAIMADGMVVGGDLLLGRGLEATGSGITQTLSLDGASIGGLLLFEPSQVTNLSAPDRRVSINGLTYPRVPFGIDLKEMISLLRHGVGDYASQPYQQLAAAHRAAGHESEARAILRAQRRHQIDSHALTGRSARLWARTTGLLLGYGYQPWRTLVGLLAVAIIAICLCLTSPALVHTKNSPSPGTPCRTGERIGVAIDLSVPLIKTNARIQCDIAGTAAGDRLAVTGWLLQALAWGFATLFVAGFTGAVRKS
ncbi:hypothetical protein ABZ388_22055 [Micromonospora parva]|uniref:hypothetical protein n=1 Tax=Micromonospora parva TaxID=1464048 RepID=UPI0033C4E7B3